MDSSTDSEAEIEPRRRKSRTFKMRINMTEITDPTLFMEKFRVSKEAFEYILEGIGTRLLHKTWRNHALSPPEQLMIALRFLGNGGQYHGIGDMHGVHKSTVKRALARVCSAVIEVMFPNEIRWPDDVSEIESKFLQEAGFPRVAGCVDGSLIPIDAPSEHEPQYVDRHGNHSLNAIFVCGPDKEFYYAGCRWPGSVHDSRVLRNSSLYTSWNEGWRPFPGAILLGDSGYPLLEWLMTPVERRGPRLGTERFLRRHRATRQLVECALGILKKKFPCLNHLRLNPEFAANVILTCATLYNVQRRFKIFDEMISYSEMETTEMNDTDEDATDDEGSGGEVYDELVRMFDAEN